MKNHRFNKDLDKTNYNNRLDGLYCIKCKFCYCPQCMNHQLDKEICMLSDDEYIIKTIIE